MRELIILIFHSVLVSIIYSLADLGGRTRRTPPPYRAKFFRFDIQNFQNVTVSGVHAPLRGPHPPTGNPGSATDISQRKTPCQFLCGKFRHCVLSHPNFTFSRSHYYLNQNSDGTIFSVAYGKIVCICTLSLLSPIQYELL